MEVLFFFFFFALSVLQSIVSSNENPLLPGFPNPPGLKVGVAEGFSGLRRMGARLRELGSLRNAPGNHPQEQSHHVRRNKLQPHTSPSRREQLQNVSKNEEARLHRSRRRIRHRSRKNPPSQGPLSPSLSLSL